MSMTMEEESKRRTAKRIATVATEIILGKASVVEASRAFDIPPSKIEEWVDEGRQRLGGLVACQADGHQGTVRAVTCRTFYANFSTNFRLASF